MLTLLAQDLNIRDTVSGLNPDQQLPGTAWASNADAGFSQFLSQLFTALFAIVGLLLLLYFIWGGIDWITSGGDQSKVANARNKITQAAIGLIVFASAFAIVNVIQLAFGLELIKFSITGTKTTSTKTSTTEKKLHYLGLTACEKDNGKGNCVWDSAANSYYAP